MNNAKASQRRYNDVPQGGLTTRDLTEEEIKRASELAYDQAEVDYMGLSPLEQNWLELFDSDTIAEYEWRLTNGRQYDAFCRAVKEKMHKLVKLNNAVNI